MEARPDFSAVIPVFANQQQRAQAVGRFLRIVKYIEATDNQSARYGDGYNRPALVRLTFEFARSAESQDKFLKAFFQHLDLDILNDNSIELDDDAKVAAFRQPLSGFADHLVNYCLLPLRAATARTPQPTPTYNVAVQQVQTQQEQQCMEDFVGIPERLAALRGYCLTRDRHRCVITGAFDRQQLKERLKQPPANDDDGNELTSTDNYSFLEVAHIIPFALPKEDGSELSDFIKATIAILDMFDIGVTHLIEGTDINRPYNAITLTLEMHRLFENFDLFLERVTETPHTYNIRPFDPFFEKGLSLPVRRTFIEHPFIVPPSERLLALHSAIGHVLHFSGAGEYIDCILEDWRMGWCGRMGVLG